jgi:hypothetical protein
MKSVRLLQIGVTMTASKEQSILEEPELKSEKQHHQALYSEQTKNQL